MDYDEGKYKLFKNGKVNYFSWLIDCFEEDPSLGMLVLGSAHCLTLDRKQFHILFLNLNH